MLCKNLHSNHIFLRKAFWAIQIVCFDLYALTWLGRRDSNPRSRSQSPLPYHLATPQYQLTKKWASILYKIIEKVKTIFCDISGFLYHLCWILLQVSYSPLWKETFELYRAEYLCYLLPLYLNTTHISYDEFSPTLNEKTQRQKHTYLKNNLWTHYYHDCISEFFCKWSSDTRLCFWNYSQWFCKTISRIRTDDTMTHSCIYRFFSYKSRLK